MLHRLRHNGCEEPAGLPGDPARAGHTDYIVNVEALAYMAQRNISTAVIEQLADGPTHFPDEASWFAHLSALGLDRRDGHARIATEGALYGAIAHHGLLDDIVVLSDDAGQFRTPTKLCAGFTRSV